MFRKWVRVDQILFTTAVLNLNAREGMPNGGNLTIKNPAAALAEAQPGFR